MLAAQWMPPAFGCLLVTFLGVVPLVFMSFEAIGPAGYRGNVLGGSLCASARPLLARPGSFIHWGPRPIFPAASRCGFVCHVPTPWGMRVVVIVMGAAEYRAEKFPGDFSEFSKKRHNRG